MQTLEDQLARLKAPPPPPCPPAIPVERERGAWWLMAAAVLLTVSFGVMQRGPYQSARGGTGAASFAAALTELRMVVERDGLALRLRDRATCGVGERVYFRVAGDPSARLTLAVEGPDGVEPILDFHPTLQSQHLRIDDGLIAYEFESPGWYQFLLTTPEGAALQSLTLEVR